MKAEICQKPNEEVLAWIAEERKSQSDNQRKPKRDKKNKRTFPFKNRFFRKPGRQIVRDSDYMPFLFNIQTYGDIFDDNKYGQEESKEPAAAKADSPDSESSSNNSNSSNI